MQLVRNRTTDPLPHFPAPSASADTEDESLSWIVIPQQIKIEPLQLLYVQIIQFAGTLACTLYTHSASVGI